MEDDSRTINLQSRKAIDVIYVDFKKGFDYVSHLKLLLKLQAYGLVGSLSAWINDFLSDWSHDALWRHGVMRP